MTAVFMSLLLRKRLALLGFLVDLSLVLPGSAHETGELTVVTIVKDGQALPVCGQFGCKSSTAQVVDD